MKYLKLSFLIVLLCFFLGSCKKGTAVIETKKSYLKFKINGRQVSIIGPVGAATSQVGTSAFSPFYTLLSASNVTDKSINDLVQIYLFSDTRLKSNSTFVAKNVMAPGTFAMNYVNSVNAYETGEADPMTLKITIAINRLSGAFSGTMIDQDDKKVQVTDGEFECELINN